MGLLGGKNSPQTSQATTSTSSNTQVSPTVTQGANSASTVGPIFTGDLSGVSNLDISTTDEGAVQGGLALAAQALDAAGSVNTASLQLANQAQDANGALAETVAQGQQNTSLKYLLYGAVAIAGIVASIYIFKKR